MNERRTPRRRATFVAVCLLAAALQACGGSNGGGSNGGGDTTPPPGQPTFTPTALPSPTPTVAVIVRGGGIAEFAKSAPSGAFVIVPPGTYAPVLLEAGDLEGPITLLADTTGELTESSPAPVVVNARGAVAGIAIFGQNGVVIEGFTVRGGLDAGILVVNSTRTIVRHCIASDNTGDGLLFEESDDTLVFNNLVFRNRGAGIGIFGTSALRAINNTVHGNLDTGISVGGLLVGDGEVQPSTAIVLRNNIINGNTPPGIFVDTAPPTSLADYDANYNLNTDGYEGAPRGPQDLNADPLFISPSTGDFHLQATMLGSTSPAIDAGDPLTAAELVAVLALRTTRADRLPDAGSPDIPGSELVDMGYHYADALLPKPSATPRPTRTNTAPPATPGVTTPTRTSTLRATPRPTRTPLPVRTFTPTRTPRP